MANDYKNQFYGSEAIPDGDKLRLNDMSLINGGKFDLSANWCATCPHAEHRVGINSDLSSLNVPVNRRAILEQFFRDRGSPNFVDETASNNHWHLRIE